MTIEVHVPALPESVTDATILSWHKQPGDTVKRDENIVDLETDKVVLEVTATAEGVIEQALFNEGDTVEAGQLLATITEGSASTVTATPAASKPLEAKAEPASTKDADVLTPAVRKLVKEHNLDPTRIKGTGKDGRILKADVMTYLDSREQQEKTDKDSQAISKSVATMTTGERPEQRVPMTRLRARIAERLTEAQQTAAILTTFNEVNLAAVNKMRADYRDNFENKHDVRLGYMSFFVKASIEALKRFTAVNASIDANDIVYHGYYDIGVAVGSPRGLVVPVLRNADQMSFADIEKNIKQLGTKAVEGTLSYEELNGGTFTISNGGIYGSMLSTPILNPPQSAILGMHNIQQRPVVENGEIVIRPMMYLALSYDHRIIDGKEAVQFLVTIKECLEDPARLLLDI
ncbi:MAG: 2-oxoglutarate dehydrogenase complex dihydrolipoyllysine-residue succinyltransferase [Gammaproteobacteria bacterium]|nr:2-oxoglutarate dehydrogenase complex dihydrolipoyllysine-residue succinyltransferase [Gammaproteobacteria bacterium]NNJ90212.1 2-oxoglutarate dehydrogenase complex dihydrolipoyllysine-residue succinyltransferase [Gammaproteobacteria bacterium]